MQLRIIPTLLILVLGAIGVFGFWSLGSLNHGEHHVCPISMVSGGNCPPVNNTLALAIHHISGLQDFTQGIVSSNLSLFILFTLLLVTFLLVFIKPSDQILSHQPFSYQKYRRAEEFSFKSNRQFLRWLALHEKRDPYALYWVHDKT